MSIITVANHTNKKTLTQAIDAAVYAFRKHNLPAVIYTEFGKFQVRAGGYSTDTTTHRITEWKNVHVDKDNMYLIRDDSITAMIEIDRSQSGKIQKLMIARAFLDAYLRYVMNVSYVDEAVVDTATVIWMDTYTEDAIKYVEYSDVANSFISGLGYSPFTFDRHTNLLRHFTWEYFKNKYDEISKVLECMRGVRKDLDGKLINAKDATGWPFPDEFGKQILTLCTYKGKTFDQTINGIALVKENLKLTSVTEVIHEVYTPKPAATAKGKKNAATPPAQPEQTTQQSE